MSCARTGRNGTTMGFLAFILGPVMALVYRLIPNYAVTMIVFTVLVRILLLPLAIKQQKSTAKMSVFQPMITEIQQKYKNNQEKQNEELMKLQQEYGYNPMSGCLPMILNLLVLFGVIEVVYRPVRYILGIPADVITAACQELGIATNNVTLMQSTLISQIQAGAACSALTADQYASIQNFNTSFLGFQMTGAAGFAITPLAIFPILAAVTMFISYFITQKLSGMSSQMQGSMKFMMLAMNLMFVWFCFTAPVGFCLYYTVGNLCQIGQSFLTYKIYSPEKFKAQYEAELAAKKAAKRATHTVVVEEKGQKVEKSVNQKELDKIRLALAREKDAEKYAGERTTPLTEAERLEMEIEGKKGRRRKK